MTDITDRIKTAMEVDSISRKNITLFEALRTIERLRLEKQNLEREVEALTQNILEDQ